MNDPRGGRITLRKADADATAVEYAGDMALAERVWACRFRVQESDGKVESFTEPAGSAPSWLVDFAVGTLRAAWRASRDGGRWPRRISRWRQGPGGEAR